MRREVGPKSGAAVASAIAGVVLLGALIDSDALRSFGTAQPMRTVTALTILVAAFALLSRRELGAAVAAVGVVALAAGEVVAVNTAICFIFIGAALLRLGRSTRGADLGALLVALIAGLALLGYLFDVPALRRGLTSPLTPMALPTALAMLALSAGLLAANPGVWLLVRSPGPGGALLRRLAPAALLVPVALAFATLEGLRNDWFDEREGLALLGAALIVAFALLLVFTAGRIEQDPPSRTGDHRRHGRRGHHARRRGPGAGVQRRRRAHVRPPPRRGHRAGAGAAGDPRGAPGRAPPRARAGGRARRVADRRAPGRADRAARRRHRVPRRDHDLAAGRGRRGAVRRPHPRHHGAA